MEIEFDREVDKCRFDTLKAGDVFSPKNPDVVYMKLDWDEEDTAVNLRNGTLETFEPDYMVTLLKAKLHVTPESMR